MKDFEEGTTHFENDGCGEPEHNNPARLIEPAKKPEPQGDSIDSMVRDFTAVGSRPKSEVRRRIEQAIEAAREEGRMIERKANIDTAFGVANATHEVILKKELAIVKSEGYQTALEKAIAAAKLLKWPSKTKGIRQRSRNLTLDRVIEALTSLQSRRPETNNEK